MDFESRHDYTFGVALVLEVKALNAKTVTTGFHLNNRDAKSELKVYNSDKQGLEKKGKSLYYTSSQTIKFDPSCSGQAHSSSLALVMGIKTRSLDVFLHHSAFHL